ncbi:MAG TPA: nucleotidyltransferase family protein [Acidobacteriota bacterium]|jgi:hypothetical protein
MKSALHPTPKYRWNWEALRDKDGKLSAERCIEQGVAGLIYSESQVASRGSQVMNGRLALNDALISNLDIAVEISRLRENYLQGFAIHKRCMAKLEGILLVMNRRGLKPLLLRGPAVVEQLYGGDGGLRRYSDVDLCVFPKEHPVLEKCLADLSFKRDRLYPQIWKLDGLALDCHQDPMNLSRNPCFDALFPGNISQIFNRARPFRIGSGESLVSDELDELSLLAIHLVKHSFSQQIWEIDLVRCIECNFCDSQIELLRRAAEESRLLRFVLYFLCLKYHCLPEKFFDSLPSLPRLCRRLAACLTRSAEPGSGPLTILLCLPAKLRWCYAKSILWPNAEVRNQIATDFNVGDREGRFFIFRLADAAKRAAKLTMWFLRG